MMQEELVSAIITTVDRVSELKRAILSIERQTYKNIEIIVVVDGTNSTIKKIIDELKGRSSLCIHYLETGEKKGGNYARNLGINHANGKYIALLDDDDEWMPKKIEKQLNVCKENNDNNIIFCSVINKKPKKKVVLPRKNFDSTKDDIVDFLFSYRYGLKHGFIQTSTLFGRKEIFESIPFDNKLQKHQDWDWVIQTNKQGVSYKQINEPLVIYHNENQNNRVGKSGTYHLSIKWIENNRDKIKQKNYYIFRYTVVQLAISADNILSQQEKKHKLSKIRKQIPFKAKCNLTYWYYYVKTNKNLR